MKMMFGKFSNLAAFALLPLVSSLTLNTPQSVTSGGEMTVTWNKADGDPSTWSLYLSNKPQFNDDYAIVAVVENSDGSLTLTLPPVNPGSGYSLKATSVGDSSHVLSQTGEFTIGTAGQQPTSPTAATSNTASKAGSGTTTAAAGSATATKGGAGAGASSTGTDHPSSASATSPPKSESGSVSLTTSTGFSVSTLVTDITSVSGSITFTASLSTHLVSSSVVVSSVTQSGRPTQSSGAGRNMIVPPVGGVAAVAAAVLGLVLGGVMVL